MSDKAIAERAEGAFEKLAGTIKRTVGHLLGNETMEAEGRVKELQGDARQASGMAVERAQGAVEQAAGVVANRVGHVIDAPKLQKKGRATAAKGKARVKKNT